MAFPVQRFESIVSEYLTSLTACMNDYRNSPMKDTVKRINIEYGLDLTEEEIEALSKQAEAAQKLFQKLYQVDVEGVIPALKIDPAERS
jgi:hypothetical protein